MSVLTVLRHREVGLIKGRTMIQELLEDSFLCGKSTNFDFKLPSSVSSTIAIGLSCDGKIVATTHGDHTVKVFIFVSGTLIRVFRGHPRTPWTVKCHPSDPDILASGCLGFEVRVWSIAADSCINMVKLDLSIISMAFHPSGDYIGIASGSNVEVWSWRRERPQSANYAGKFGAKRIEHNRNIRAVMFHPAGNYLLIAAPDSPKLPNETQSHCRLYAIRFFSLLDSSAGEPLQLINQSVLLPQVHLYSDGGLDLSQDGQYLLTTVRLDCHRTKFPIYGAFAPPKGQHYVQLAFDPDANARLARQFNGRDLNPLERWSLVWNSQGGKLLKFGDVRAPGTTSEWLPQDHVCLIRLSFDANGVIQLPVIVNSVQLPGSLSRAVTSTKISPTCRYALVGYGVRLNNMVTDHPLNPQTACEVLSLERPLMKCVSIMCDMEDEVNIAQFHPVPGYGIVYGTKRGKVRCFAKS